MSFSKACNAVIALVEGRTKVAREILSDPGLDLGTLNIYVLQHRLEQAVATVVMRENCSLLKQILVDALRLEAEGTVDVHAFLQGQEQLIQLIERKVEDLEARLGAEVHLPRAAPPPSRPNMIEVDSWK